MSYAELMFPAFGDADDYNSLGDRYLNQYRQNGISSLFDPDWRGSTLRPIGSVLYNLIPKLISSNKIDESYILLLQNILFLFLAVYAVWKILEQILPNENNGFTAFLSLIICLVNYFPHIPVRGMDLPPSALFLCSLYFMNAYIKVGDNDPEVVSKNLLFASLLISLAGILKQTWFVWGYLTLLLYVLSDWRKIREALTSKLIILLPFANFGILLQCSYIYMQTGYFWIYEVGALDGFSPSKYIPYIGLIPYCDDVCNAYLLSVFPKNAGHLEWLFLKLQYAIFQYDFEIYKSTIKFLGGYFHLSSLQVFILVILTFMWFGVLVIQLRFQKLSAAGLMALFCIFQIFVTVFMGQVEVRYVIVSKILWSILTLFMTIKLLRKFDGMYDAIKVNENKCKIVGKVGNEGNWMIFFCFVIVQCSVFSIGAWVVNSSNNNIYDYHREYVIRQLETIKLQNDYLEKGSINKNKYKQMDDNLDCLALADENEMSGCFNKIVNNILINQRVIDENQRSIDMSIVK